MRQDREDQEISSKHLNCGHGYESREKAQAQEQITKRTGTGSISRITSITWVICGLGKKAFNVV